MSSATIVSEAYGEGACLYETVLGVSKDASPSQLRKAYYKKCLTYHPDKLSTDLSNDERELAKKKFQAISLAYAILSDDEKRKEYDESGEFYDDDEDFASSKEGVNQWTEYFNNIFPKVTTADIEAFEVKYKCSDEEEADVLRYYSQFKGDLNKMLECVMLSSDVDKERWVKDYIGPAVTRGDVDNYMAKIHKTLGHAPTKKTKNNTKPSGGKRGKKKTEDEMEEDGSDDESDTPVAQVVDQMDDDDDDNDDAGVPTTKHNKSSTTKSSKTSSNNASASKKSSTSKTAKCSKKSTNTDDDLIAQIRGNALARRQAGFDSLMAGLEERYGGDNKKNGKKRQQRQKSKDDDGDIDDDEFARIQAKMMKSKESKQRSK